MTRRNYKIARNIGLPPGTLVYSGKEALSPVEIQLFVYDSKGFDEKKIEDLSELKAYLESKKNLWININGLQDISLLEEAGKIFSIHPLFLEDVLNIEQRPKLEEGSQGIFSILKMLSYQEEKKQIKLEQVSMILGKNYVVTFQEEKGDVFEPIRERIRGAKGRIRKMNADYLFYSLIDAVVDNYFIVLEKMSEQIDSVETEIFENPSPGTLQRIHGLKRESLKLKKAIWPLREMIGSLDRLESPLIGSSVSPYLRDLYDHAVQAIDYIETFRDSISSIQDLYLSTVSNKMNEVMKVLTIIATIFIPLTFLAGIYGMNFKHMPELDKNWAYPAFWGLITGLAAMMVFYFKRKKWF